MNKFHISCVSNLSQAIKHAPLHLSFNTYFQNSLLNYVSKKNARQSLKTKQNKTKDSFLLHILRFPHETEIPR